MPAVGYYNAEDLQKRQGGGATKVPPKANLLAAVNQIRGLFERKKLVYGVMGRFEMLCLGHRRDISDLQIAYDARDFHRIKAKLEGDPRYA